MRIKLLALAAFVALVGGGVSWAVTPDSASASATTSIAAKAPWQANGQSRITGPSSLLLSGDNTSVETLNLDTPVQAQWVISFRYTLQGGATCTAGAPRVFVEIGGTYVNSWDQNVGAGKQCGTNGTVTFTASKNGRIGNAGIVYDNAAGGKVQIDHLTVNGSLVLFEKVKTNRPPKHWPPYHHKHGHRPPPVRHSPTPHPSTPVTSPPPGEAPVPTPVKSDLGVTG